MEGMARPQVEKHRVEQAQGDGDGNQLSDRMSMKEIQRSMIGASPSCIRLSPTARNYELKNIRFIMLPSFYGLPSENPLTFLSEF